MLSFCVHENSTILLGGRAAESGEGEDITNVIFISIEIETKEEIQSKSNTEKKEELCCNIQGHCCLHDWKH